MSSIVELLGSTMIIPLLATVVRARQSRLGLTEAIQPWVEAIGLPHLPVTAVLKRR